MPTLSARAWLIVWNLPAKAEKTLSHGTFRLEFIQLASICHTGTPVCGWGLYLIAWAAVIQESMLLCRFGTSVGSASTIKGMRSNIGGEHCWATRKNCPS